MGYIVSGRSIDGRVYVFRRPGKSRRYGWTSNRADATELVRSEASRVISERIAANAVSDADCAIGRLESIPVDSVCCTWRKAADSDYVGINADRRLFVLPCGDGYTTLGFDVAEKKRKAVLEWCGLPCPDIPVGTVESYVAYRDAMASGRRHADATRTRCPMSLEPALIGLEGERVAIIGPDGRELERFYVGKSAGWAPIHLAIARRDSSGGPAAYIPDGATVRVIGSR